MGVLSKLYNIIIYIYSLVIYIKLFKSYAGKRILFNNRTRWNSWFYILIIALKYKNVVNKYIKENLLILLKDSLTL